MQRCFSDPRPRSLLAGVLLAVLLAAPVQAQLSATDQQVYRLAFKAVDKKKLNLASKLAIPARDRLLAKVILWRRMTNPGSKFDFSDYRTFLQKNPDWPGQRALAREAERTLPEDLPAADKLTWFNKHPAISGRGSLLHLEALAATGNNQQLKTQVPRDWVSIRFSRSQETEFLSLYRPLLTERAHHDRLERLIRAKQTTAALRQARRMGDTVFNLTDARLKLSRRAPGVDSAIARVPQKLRDDPGLVHARIDWRLGKNRLAGALELLDPPVAKIEDPAWWWNLRKRATRMALTANETQAAYRLVSDHGLTSGIGFAQGEFLAGWLALRHHNKPAQALPHFIRLHDGVSSPISRSRGAFWAGEAALALGQSAKAAHWYAIAAQYGQSFYGQLAANRLSAPPVTVLPGAPRISPAQAKAFAQQDAVGILKRLAQIQAYDSMKPFFSILRAQAETSDDFIQIAQLAKELKRPNQAIFTAKRAGFLGIWLPNSLHPAPAPVMAALKRQQEPESALVLSLIRQESAFDSKAVSRAGARGLMQIMPATAKLVARQEKLSYSKQALTKDSIYNVTLGTAYLARLLEDYDGFLPLALAAYNAGPNRAKAWIKRNGDPRDPKVDTIDWIESIPFSETRNYVQRIMESLSIYSAKLDVPAPSLASRLGYSASWQGRVMLAGPPAPSSGHSLQAASLTE
ncbi:lytic transglycosylase domain-containing protein [Rhodovibrionaceae bacterium A322]